MAKGLAYTLSPAPGAGIELTVTGAVGGEGAGAAGLAAGGAGVGAAAAAGLEGALVPSSLKSLKAAISDSFSTIMQTSWRREKQ